MRGWLTLLAAVLVGCVPAVGPTPSPAASPSNPLVSNTAAPTLTPLPTATLPTPLETPTSTASPPPSTSWMYGLPRRDLTPGVTNPTVGQADITSTICVNGWTATVRPPVSYTTPLKILQIGQYGYADTATADYEEDHLIALELGGNPTDPRNLWPEPYTAALADGTPIGAHVKDDFENELHGLVCQGQLPLTSAQQAIASNWVSAWETLRSGGSLVASPGD